MGEQEFCVNHSGCKTQISTLEGTVKDHETRLRDIEKAVWKAAASCGIITSIGVVVIQHYMGK